MGGWIGNNKDLHVHVHARVTLMLIPFVLLVIMVAGMRCRWVHGTMGTSS